MAMGKTSAQLHGAKMTQFAMIVLGFVLVGCSTTNLPPGARLVGGGIEVEYKAPDKGTVILIDRTSGRIVATKSLDEGDRFDFGPNYQGFDEVAYNLFGRPQVSTNASFQLYFVPVKEEKH